ncbi:MAG: hypothetical protein KA841_00585 [Chitinophagales bacterium]|nr:hypothetical protein [Chitinophagales bacterium]
MSKQQTFPISFEEGMKKMLGENMPDFLNSLQETPPTSIRLNPRKRISKFNDEENLAWCSTGKYLPTRPSFTFDPLFHAGTYYVQEAASMFIEQVWKAINAEDKELRVLDMCAAPGGKSTHLLSLLKEDSLLVSNEMIPNRNAVLRENITKWGYANCIVTQNNPADFVKLGEYFDVILVDAPCSGEGMFRKDKNAIAEWSEKNVEQCSLRQHEILKSAVSVLKPGGYIIYSTCTFEYAENDAQIAFGINEMDMQPIVLDFPGVTKTKFGLQFFPHMNKGEGFFIALMRKPVNGIDTFNHGAKNFTSSADSLSVATTFIENPDAFVLLKRSELVFAIPKVVFQSYQWINSTLFVKQAGFLVGELKGKDFIPAHSMALSIYLNSTIPKIELDEVQSISFLKCESIKANCSIRGWAVVTFQNHPLGWIKVLDNRTNNYYPREWRILKDKA